MCTGPPITEGGSFTIKVNMTVPASPTGGPGEYYWTASAKNSTTSGGYLGKYSILAVVDSSTPIISFVPAVPTYYSVGSGNYMWINATIMGTPSIATYFSGYTVTINDTRFVPYASQPQTEINSTAFMFFYVNNTAIPDGPFSVEITAVDPAGNTGMGSFQTTVDNTKPALTYIYVYGYDTTHGVYYLHEDSSGTYWMTAATTNVFIYAVFYNPSGFSARQFQCRLGRHRLSYNTPSQQDGT